MCTVRGIAYDGAVIDARVEPRSTKELALVWNVRHVMIRHTRYNSELSISLSTACIHEWCGLSICSNTSPTLWTRLFPTYFFRSLFPFSVPVFARSS